MHDVVVVGGGLVGTSVAASAVRAGARVLLVDRADHGRATDAGAGILSPETTKNDDPAWVDLALGAGAYYRRLVPKLIAAGLDPGYGPCSLVTWAATEDDLPLYRWGADLILGRQARTGSPPTSSLHEVADPGPPAPVAVTPRAALISDGAAKVDGRRMCAALRSWSIDAGLEVRHAGVDRLVTERHRVRGIRIDGEEIAAGSMVIAGGAWSPAFGEQLGVRIKLRPERGQIAHLEVPGADTERWPIMQRVGREYLVPWAGGRVAVGATSEPEAGFDARVTAGGVTALLGMALEALPGLAGATLHEVRVGLRPVSRDWMPVLGPVPSMEGVHLCTGHGADGLLLGPWSGELVARSVMGLDAGVDLTPFSVARFG